jgi:signal peptidase I
MAGDDRTDEGFFATWRSAALRPRELYARPVSERRRWSPHAFALVVGAIAAGVGGLLQGVLLHGQGAGAIGGAVGALILSPVSTLASVYLSAALAHFWLLVLQGSKGGFRDTVAAVCYATAPGILGAVPLLGTAVGAVWGLVALCIGLKYAQRTTAGRAIAAVLLGTGTPVLLALFLRAGVVEAFKIPSGAMIPSIMVGDHLFVNKFTYGPFIPFTEARLFSRLPPRRGDVMVFKFPENKEQDFIKRVIAVPGDRLEAINGRPVINGWLVPHCHVGPFKQEARTSELYVEFLGEEAYLTLFDDNPDEQTCTGNEGCGAGLACRAGLCGMLQGPFAAAPGEVWVMGDSRNNSHDSRSWRNGLGAGVPFENIKGRAMFVWMSFLPGGGIAQDRLFVSLHGSPTLPAGHDALRPALEKCLRERPPLSQTTPPARRSAP